MFVTHDPRLWRRALYRAEARGISLERKGSDGTKAWYVATSFSRTETRHGLCVEAGPAGVEVLCSCEAGQAERVCQYAAAVLRHCGLLPDACLEELPVPVPAPTPLRRVLTVNDLYVLEDA